MSDPLAESYRLCRRLARSTGKNFYFSFLVLPRDLYRDMCVLYAYMRATDDLGDDHRLGIEERRKALTEWEAAVDRQFANPAEPRTSHLPTAILPAAVDMARRRGIPSEHLKEVIHGVASDLSPREFVTFDELSRYCYQVAGVVGLCCIQIWGYRDGRARELAVDCGAAFQLTNILRDLAEDVAAGRVYLPREDLDRFGYSAADIARHVRNDPFRELMRFEAGRARELYSRASGLEEYLDRPGKRVLSVMMRIYGSLLSEIERRQYDVYSQRVELSPARKLGLTLAGMISPRTVFPR